MGGGLVSFFPTAVTVIVTFPGPAATAPPARSPRAAAIATNSKAILFISLLRIIVVAPLSIPISFDAGPGQKRTYHKSLFVCLADDERHYLAAVICLERWAAIA